MLSFFFVRVTICLWTRLCSVHIWHSGVHRVCFCWAELCDAASPEYFSLHLFVKISEGETSKTERQCVCVYLGAVWMVSAELCWMGITSLLCLHTKELFSRSKGTTELFIESLIAPTTSLLPYRMHTNTPSLCSNRSLSLFPTASSLLLITDIRCEDADFNSNSNDFLTRFESLLIANGKLFFLTIVWNEALYRFYLEWMFLIIRVT